MTRVIKFATGLRSIPIAFRPNLRASIMVTPDPENASSIISPGSVYDSIYSAIISDGLRLQYLCIEYIGVKLDLSRPVKIGALM